MQTIIYGDVLFAVNFSMDFLTLYITCRILSLRVRLIPLVFASAIGALYAVAALFFETGRLTDALIAFAVSLLVSNIAFGYYGIRSFIRDAAVFWAVSLMLGGVMTAIFYAVSHFTGIKYAPDSIGAHASSLPPRLMLVSACAAAIFTLVCSRLTYRRRHSRTVTVNAEYRGRNASFNALFDTGNLLTEPISGRPVVIITNELFDALTGGSESLLKAGIEAKLRFIPASSINGEQLLTAVVPDNCEIGGRKRDVVIARGGDSGYDGYDGIVGGEI